MSFHSIIYHHAQAHSVLTSIVRAPPVLVLADAIKPLNFRNDLLVERNHITRLDVGGLILLQQQESVADANEVLEDGLLVRIKRDGHGGGFHGGIE